MENHFFLYVLSALMLFTAFKTISHRHPAYGALYLALTMVLLAGVFFLMGAHFLAGLQLLIYAGAVIVLFVMVLMLFDFKQIEESSITQKTFIFWPLFLLGIISGLTFIMAVSSLPKKELTTTFFSAKHIALTLFTKYVLLFEIMGVVLLLIAIGVVAVLRLEKD